MAPANSSSTAAEANGPGNISDAWTAFTGQAAQLPAGPAADANVSVAWALGWLVGDALTCTRYGVFEHLPEVPELGAADERWKLLVNQIITRCGRLNTHLRDANAGLDLSDQLTAAGDLQLDPAKPGGVKAAVRAKHVSVEKLHTGILEVLWSVESLLGKAYRLGREMEQMCTAPTAEKFARTANPIQVKASVKKHGTTVHSLLGTLASKLPANAAHATDNSLRLWSASLSAGGAETERDLLHQGWRWRELLAGDVAGTDRLRLSDYVAAADSVAGKLWDTAREVLARFRAGLLIALAVAIIGIALIVWGTRGTLSAGIVSVVAALGLTWKGIGEFFGRAAANGEAQLWNAEIDWAIAYRITILRNAPAGKDLKRLNYDQPTKEHMQRFNKWKQTWPDVDVS